jgi:hypothetical protein
VVAGGPKSSLLRRETAPKEYLPTHNEEDEPRHEWVLPASQMDVVLPLHTPNCITTFVINGLNKFFGPRRILVATRSEHCAHVESLASNVVCIDESKIVPGVTLQSTQHILASLDEKRNETVGFGGHSIEGWYLQQFVKLGIAESSSHSLSLSPPLSQTYLAWDADMILLKQFHAFDVDGRIQIMGGGDRVCGRRNPCDYDTSYTLLVQKPCFDSSFGHGQVAHHMVMYRPYVLEMLTAFKGATASWASRVLETACKDLAKCDCGFSEYHSMASWLKATHPHAVVDVPPQFTRITPTSKAGNCCPSEADLAKARNAGKLFAGFERGGCNDIAP